MSDHLSAENLARCLELINQFWNVYEDEGNPWRSDFDGNHLDGKTSAELASAELAFVIDYVKMLHALAIEAARNLAPRPPIIPIGSIESSENNPAIFPIEVLTMFYTDLNPRAMKAEVKTFRMKWRPEWRAVSCGEKYQFEYQRIPERGHLLFWAEVEETSLSWEGLFVTFRRLDSGEINNG